MFLRSLLLLSMPVVASAAEPAPGTLFYQSSWPEASAVAMVGTPPKWLAVADNETPVIALYPLEPMATNSKSPALTAGTSPVYAVDDLEGCTIFPWDINGDGKPEKVYHVFTASCARTKKGKVIPDREALFALYIAQNSIEPGNGGAFPAAATVEYNRTLRSQIRALGSERASEPWGKILSGSVSVSAQKMDAQDASLAGENGLNIEGLTVSADGRSLMLGLRSPLVEGKALLIPVTNPVAALGLGESAPQPVALGEPQMLDFGGLGFRSIEWDAEKKVYLIVAGSAGDEGVFRFFSWTGEAKDAPVPSATPSAAAGVKIRPEGVAPLPGRKSAVVVGDNANASFHKAMWVDFGAKK